VDDWIQQTSDCTTDLDNDGFPFEWESSGLDLDCDGVIGFFDYPANFFNTALPTVHIEVDWMAGDAFHSHDLSQGDLQDMIDTYDQNGDIALDLDFSNEIPHHDGILLAGDSNPNLLDDDDWVYYPEIERLYFTDMRRGVYHYALVAHDWFDDGHTGISPGRAHFLVTLGSADLQDQASVFFHEGGHNLGLDHAGVAGDGGLDNAENNYQSGMNYAYGYRGLDPIEDTGSEGVDDYSSEELAPLDEAELVENVFVDLGDCDEDGNAFEVVTPLGGTLVAPRYWFEWTCPDGSPGVADPLDQWVDFDCDCVNDGGLAPDCTGDTVAVDLNADGAFDLLTGAKDWHTTRIDLAFQHFAGDSAEEDARDPARDSELGLVGSRRPRLEVLPGCPEDALLPFTPGRVVTAVMHGSLRLDVGLIDPLRTWLGGAHPFVSALRDADLDGYVDLVLEVRAEDLTAGAAAEVVHFAAYTNDGLRVTRTLPAAFATDDPDSDGDGIHDACDACPADGNAPRGPDGCPW
jgi:hypothetical protein